MPRKSATEKPKCYIHDKAYEGMTFHNELSRKYIDDIRQNVCVNDLPLTKGGDGKHYCLFHLPTENKDSAKFEKKFQERLDSVKQQIVEIEVLPEEQQEEAKKKLSYQFRYVWFPSEINFRGYKFEVEADFGSATFSNNVDFTWATFLGRANFRNSTFSSGAHFEKSVFCAEADFEKAIFSIRAYFGSANFSSNADFSSVTFSGDAVFAYATFCREANFSKATFANSVNFWWANFSFVADFKEVIFFEKSRTHFRQTRFCGEVDFQRTIFSGYVAFEGGIKKDFFNIKEKVFLDGNAVSTVKENLKLKFETLKQTLAERGIDFRVPITLEINQEVVLNLQNAHLEKPERISFHRVRLCPSWFVNSDSRKMVFTDIRWTNLKSKLRNENIKAELENLRKRGISEPYSLIEIACRQLTFNSEENNRYDEASDFRKMANESKRLAEYRGYKIWSLHWWYWLSSFYGESWQRALTVLLVILIGFVLIYSQILFQVCPMDKPLTLSIQQNLCETRNLHFGEAVLHSLATATFQNLEYQKPVTLMGEIFRILEKIFAPLQVALLALAIRRKFMR